MSNKNSQIILEDNRNDFSFKKNELNNIAKGIASCDPIIIGETITPHAG